MRSDGIYQYQLSAYKALCDVRVQLSLFALLADCMIPLYCLLAFSLKNKQTNNLLFPGEGQVVIFTSNNKPKRNPFWDTHFYSDADHNNSTSLLRAVIQSAVATKALYMLFAVRS